MIGISVVLLGLPVYAVGPQDTIAATFTLADQPLATIQNTALPHSLTDDRGFMLGSIGSDLWHDPAGPADEFWMLSDRGPNGQIRSPGAPIDSARRTFPVADFDPLILKVRATGGQLNVVQTLPILDTQGQPVTGLPNLAGKDETPYNFDASTRLPFNPNGLDTEGLVHTRTGDFWIAEEYRPSIVHVGADGRVIRRYIPAGVTLNADYPVSATLPAIFDARNGNRGFEGLAISPDERTLFVALQSPLANPDPAAAEASRNTRILAVDVASGEAVAEYVYRFEDATAFDPGTKRSSAPQDDLKVSGLTALDATTLLVLERTDAVAHLYQVNLNAATNILSSPWDDRATTPSLEQTTDLATANIVPLPKTLAVDLQALPGMPTKVEGVTVVAPNLIAVANDNDFNINPTTGISDSTGDKSELVLITTVKPLLTK